MATSPLPITNLPNYLTDKDAVLKDENTKWLNGSTPNYDVANQRWARERSKTHTAGSLPDLVSNLVKNWEKEASHKTEINQWRTVDPEQYTFATNGGPKSSAADMVKIGTYNALIGESEYYASSKLNFDLSHKVFRQALGTGFAWEVLEVYSGPPTVVFKWRHWGTFNGELRCPMRSGPDLIIPPHHQTVEIFGVTVAEVNDKFQITALDTYYSPNQLFESMMRKIEDEIPEVTGKVQGIKLVGVTTSGVKQEVDLKDAGIGMEMEHGKK